MGTGVLRSLVVTLVASILAAPATAAVGPEGKCEAGKNQESGKYAFCLHKAEAKLLKTKGACSVTTETDCYRDEDCPGVETCNKDTTKYGEAVTKCEDKYAAKWNTLELKATEASAICPDGLLQADVKQVIDECVSNVASGLAGEGMPDCTGDLAMCTSDLGTCSGDLGTCNGSLSTCTTDLGTAQTELTTCNGDLGTCQSDLGQSQSDLATCNGDLGTCTGDLATCTGDLATCNASLGTCPADLAACQAEPKGQRVRTGQILCYDTAGSVIACAGTGQDGELQEGLTVSFTDNGDGTISDGRTGLMWEKLDDNNANGIHDFSATFTWANAFNKVKVLNGDATGCIAANNPDACCTGAGTGSCSPFAGQTDWRLPNINELQSLANYGTFVPAVNASFYTGCVAACTTSTCSCTQPSFYWSATTRQGGTTVAWFVVFSEGIVNLNAKTNNFFVRAVRGGS